MDIDHLHLAVINYLEEHALLVNESTIETALANIAGVDQTTYPEIVDRMLGYGPITDLLRDPDITEIMVNGPKQIFIEKAGKLQVANKAFDSKEELLAIIGRMASSIGRRIDTFSPLVDGRLKDGSRINAVIEPISLKGPCLTIRRFPGKPMSLEDLSQKGACSSQMLNLLVDFISCKKNIIISGGTGSGKTTLLNALTSRVPIDERIVTIEDSAEMRINHPHLISLESRLPNVEGTGEIPIRSLVRNSLRMRPDRIIVGEIRGGEALDMLQAMNTGHQGSLSTVHANSPLDALLRIETMAMMADVKMPLEAIRQQVKQAVHIIIQQERLTTGQRMITSISQVSANSESTDYTIIPIAIYDKSTDTHNLVA